MNMKKDPYRMTKIALTIACTFFLCTVGGYSQTTGSFSRVRVADTLSVRGKGIADVVYSITSTSKNNQLPTAKAVYSFVNGLNLLDSVTTTSRLTGYGTAASPLDIAQQGATSGQVLRWSGTAWVPDGVNNYSIVTTSQTVSAALNQVWVNDISSSITLNLPACNSANDGVKIEIVKAGADTNAVLIEPAGSEEFVDGETSKTLYSRGIGLACTCRWTGSVGFWLYIMN